MTRPTTPAGTGSPELDKLLADAREVVERMTPEQRAAMWEAQRQSWARGEMAMGESAVMPPPPPTTPDALSEALSRTHRAEHEAATLRAENVRLRELLSETATRFERAVIASGTDPEFAAIAAADIRARAALKGETE